MQGNRFVNTWDSEITTKWADSVWKSWSWKIFKFLVLQLVLKSLYIGLTKSQPHDHTRPHSLNSGTRLHAMMHASRSLRLKHIFHYFVSFVFNRLLHDIYFHRCTFSFLLFLNLIKFWSVFRDALRICRQLTVYSIIMPFVRSARAVFIMRSVVVIIMVQSAPDCAVVQSAFSKTHLHRCVTVMASCCHPFCGLKWDWRCWH